MYDMPYVWKSENNSWGVLSHHVGPGDQTEVLRLDSNRLYLQSHLVSLPSSVSQILGTKDWGAGAENLMGQKPDAYT